jgi:DNA-binding transcriptional regulator YiaG
MTPADFKSGRNALGLSIAELAVALDTDPRTIRKWEALHGNSARPPNPIACRVLGWMLAGFRPPEWPEGKR